MTALDEELLVFEALDSAVPCTCGCHKKRGEPSPPAEWIIFWKIAPCGCESSNPHSLWCTPCTENLIKADLVRCPGCAQTNPSKSYYTKIEAL